MQNLGASIFPVSAGTDLVTAITTAITDNIGTVLVVFGFMVGVKWALRALNKGARGRI